MIPSSSSACPELERSGFHEVLPVFSILGASPSRVETKIMRLEICVGYMIHLWYTENTTQADVVKSINLV